MNDFAPRLVDCPCCGAQVEWHSVNLWRPFCSERCKMIDLGAWAAESYRLPDESLDGEGQDLETSDGGEETRS